MFISNAIKVVGCLMMLFGGHPLLAYAHRRPRRGGLLAGQVRHPDRAAAELAAGQGQRLDRGPDDPVDHPRRAARRPAGRPRDRRASCSAFDMPMFDTGIDTAPEAAIAADRRCSTSSPRCSTCASRAPRRRCSRSPRNVGGAGARLLELQRAPVERQARPDLAGDDDAVLGRLAATCACIVFAWAAAALGYTHDAGLVAGRRGRDRHRGRRGRRVDAHAAGPGDQRDPARHRAWACW